MPSTAPDSGDFLELAGSVVLVTGASSGIGRSVAEHAARAGATVVLLARREAELRELCGELPGGGHLAVPFDLRASDDIPDMLRGVVDAVGPLDGLVHAAGVHRAVPLRSVTAAQADEMFAMNVTTGLMLTKGFRHKQVRGAAPSIVFLSSATALVGEPGVVVYSATKGAVAALSRSLALELVREGIRSNAVAAGIVQTELTEGIRTAIGAEAWSRVEAAHPLGVGEAPDVARAVLFLLSPASRWITGTTLVVDGGYTAQ
ncbi:SDR family NAD(P)-dependent oxidoreductase [Microcella sp.]|uniref:SDR family NAD(P)-dependent oxidoreductase n=1 Tax=Microcella sp. TaxID=1913979 RepID=UPI003F72537B